MQALGDPMKQTTKGVEPSLERFDLLQLWVEWERRSHRVSAEPDVKGHSEGVGSLREQIGQYLDKQGDQTVLSEESLRALLSLAYEALGVLGSIVTFQGLEPLLDAQHRSLSSYHCFSRQEAEQTA